TTHVTGTVEGPDRVSLANVKELDVRSPRAEGANETLALRHERFELYDLDEPMPDGHTKLRGKVIRRMYYGDAYFYNVEVGLDHPLEVKEENRPDVETYEMGEETVVCWDPAAVNVVTD